MADYTEHYNLKKPAANDWYSVEDQNGNSDIIDGALHDLAQAAAGLTEATTDLAEGKVDKVDGKGLSTNDYNTAEKTKVALANTHLSLPVNTPNGVHGLRVVEENLEYKQDGEWKPLASKDVVKYVPQELTDEQKAQARQNIGVKSSAIALKAATDVTAVSGNTTVSLNWSDPADAVIEGYTFAKWAGTLVVRKEGSAPANENDGVVVVNSVIRDQYASEPFTDTGLVNDTEYFYGLFPYTEDGVYNYDCTISAIPGLTPIKLWTQTIGLDYDSLDDITEVDMRQLMTKHASADYLYSWLTTDVEAVDMFTANAYAMKWIGLRDYICDKLMSVESIKTAMLASEHWRYILKDHVPTMASNTAPYGECFASSNLGSSETYKAWKAFDDSSAGSSSWVSVNKKVGEFVGYKFTNPICIKKFLDIYTYGVNKFLIQASNDNASWVTLGEFDGNVNHKYAELNNDNYYIYYRLYVSEIASDGNYFYCSKLQFYGRSLDVSVPTMTSNTQPYGEVSASSEYGNAKPWCAFGATEFWQNGYNRDNTADYIQYKATKPYCVKEIALQNYSERPLASSWVLKGSNDGNNFETIATFSTTNSTALQLVSCENDKSYLYHRIYCANSDGNYYNTANLKCIIIVTLNFYGVDYSDRTERTYLYDHGVEIVALTKTDTSVLANIDVSDKSLLRATVSDYATASDKLQCGTAFALANNLPNNFYLDISNINGVQSTGFSVIDGTHLDTISLWLE